MTNADPQIYELSIVRSLQEMTTRLVEVQTSTAAQTVELKAFVQQSTTEFRQEITRTVLSLSENIVDVRRALERETTERQLAMQRETTERTRRQMEIDARADSMARRLDRYMTLIFACVLLMAAIAVRLWLM